MFPCPYSKLVQHYYLFFLDEDEALLSGNWLTQKCVVANKAKLEHKEWR